MPTNPPLDAAALAAIEARANAASHGAEVWRYDHGGGRMAIIEDDGSRQLVADFYHVEDREFYAHALADVYDLLDALTAARAECARLREERDGYAAVAEDAVSTIQSGRRCSMGGIDDTYAVHVKAHHVGRWRAAMPTPTPPAPAGGAA